MSTELVEWDKDWLWAVESRAGVVVMFAVTPGILVSVDLVSARGLRAETGDGVLNPVRLAVADRDGDREDWSTGRCTPD